MVSAHENLLSRKEERKFKAANLMKNYIFQFSFSYLPI